MAQSANHPLVCDQVFNRNLPLIGQNFTFPRVAILLFNEAKLILDNPKNARLLCKDIHQIFDFLDNLVVVILDLFPLQRHKLIQSQFKNRIHLTIGEDVVIIHQTRLIPKQNTQTLCGFPCKRITFHL